MSCCIILCAHFEAQASLVVGVDVSRKLLLKAKEQARALQNVFILRADADHLPFRNDFFEGVFAFTILQNRPKPSETLGESKIVEKAGLWLLDQRRLSH